MVDTPAFGDDDDEALIGEMVEILDYSIGHANTILLMIKFPKTRFDPPFQQMLKTITHIFGQAVTKLVQYGAYCMLPRLFW